MFSTGVQIKEIAAGVAGFIWGIIVPILAWGFRDKLRLGKFARILHLHDPLLGSPTWIDKKRRHYEFRSQLPRFDSVLSIENIKAVDILSISAHTITLDYIETIKKAVSRDVILTFLILDPKSGDCLDTQSKNYPAGDKLNQHITDSLEALCNVRNNISDKKDKIIIRLYNKIIRNGIMIVHLDSGDWIKVEDYVIGSEPNSRPSQAAYKKDDPNFFDYNKREYDSISKDSEDYFCV